MRACTHSIIFDWNGTLLDDTHAVFDSTNAMLRALARPEISRETFHENYSIPIEEFYVKVGFDKPEELHSDAARNAFHNYYETLAITANLREGAREILGHTHAAGVQSLILSNHIVDPIREQLRRLSIEHYFSDVLAYANREVQFREMTKGERLRQYMHKTKFFPKQAIIIGDSPEEIEIAHELNLVSVAITGGCFSEQRLIVEEPDHLIHSLHELSAILQVRGFIK